ncbi:MAG: efflux RND transporter periplasmic adaptor subunit [Saprospiraceae bacterium]|nr:efflux RND transporter periplasmic adaptor subunit [Saprospiraceae bacterium]
MQKIHIKILILFLLLTLMLGCKQKEETPAAPTGATVIPSAVQLTEAQFGNANLQVSLPEKVKIGHVIALNGKIETMPENTITVSSPMAGFIKQLKLIPGMMVSKGQVLVRLEDKEIIQLQQDYLSAKMYWRTQNLILNDKQSWLKTRLQATRYGNWRRRRSDKVRFS